MTAAREKYSIRRKMKAWERIFEDVLRVDKKKRVWGKRKHQSGSEIFIESLAKYGGIFKDYICAAEQSHEENLKRSEDAIIKIFQSNSQWYSNNKGGVKQYLRIFPDDPFLLAWEKLLR
jgi:predicted RNA-binding protein